MFHHRQMVSASNYANHSKLTFSKSGLLASFNCKTVAIKKIRLPKKLTWRGGHFMTYYMLPKKHMKARTLHDILHWTSDAPNSMFTTVCFASVVSLGIHVESLNDERGKEKDMGCCHLYYWLNRPIIDNCSSKLLFSSVGCQLATFTRIWVAKYFSTRHGEQNGGSLEHWIADKIICHAFLNCFERCSSMILYLSVRCTATNFYMYIIAKTQKTTYYMYRYIHVLIWRVKSCFSLATYLLFLR